MSLKKSVISEFTEVRMFVLYEMSGHDIDTMFDWELAEVIVTKKYNSELC